MTASAWDVAGAVVWTLLMTALATVLYADFRNFDNGDKSKQSSVVTWSFVLFLPVVGGVAWCIARLCGAHA